MSTHKKYSFDGSWAVVTGAGRGIGRACAIQLAQRGADVVVISRTATELDKVAAEIRRIGRQAIVLPVDIGDAIALERKLATLPPDVSPQILINNASVIKPFGKVWESDPHDWAKLININVIGTYLMTRWALRFMMPANQGSIVNISSGVAEKNLQGTSAYNTSKAALERFCGTLAAEVADTDISVSILRPGRVDTQMQDDIRDTPESQFPAVANWIAAHKNGDLLAPDIPALAALWLAGPGAHEFHGRMVDVRDDGFYPRVQQEMG